MLAEAGLSAAELARETARVAAKVDAIFSSYLASSNDARDRLFEAMRYIGVGGGKRLRPLLTVATGRLFGLAEDRAVRAGSAIEAIHVYSLIHDDLPCMDDDDLRRGKPTVHKAFDESTAVLAGDCFHDLAFEIIADPATHEDPFIRSELVIEMARASGPHGMAGGQMLDLAAQGQALDHLRDHGEEADLLRAIARYVEERDR